MIVKAFTAFGVILTKKEVERLAGKYDEGELQIIECGNLALNNNEKVLVIISTLHSVDVAEEPVTNVSTFILDSKVAKLRAVCQEEKLAYIPDWLLWVNCGTKGDNDDGS